MRYVFTAALAFGLTALPAAADNLSRLEAATELGGSQVANFMISRAPELEPHMPSWEWDDAYRAAGACFLETLQASDGAAGVESYLSALEAFAQKPLTSLEDTSNQPAAISSPSALAASQSCGVTALTMQRMQESGLMGAMMNEATMSKLGG